MKAFIRQTSWSHLEPDKLRIELEVTGPGEAAKVGKMFPGAYVNIYSDSRWERFIKWIGGRK